MSDKPSIFSEALQATSNNQEQQLLDYKDYDAVRQNIFDKIYNSVSSAFPIENERYKLTVEDLKYKGMDEYRSTMEKDAVLTGSDINKRLTGKYKLIDKSTGKTVDTSGNVTLMSIPYLTDRGEFVRRGVRYTVPRQFRVDPGVYTRIADNGMIETNVNIKSGTGHNFKIEFDPDKSTFYYKLGDRKIPLVYLMESMGIPSNKIKEVMGEGIYDLNAKIRPSPHAISWVSRQLQQDKEAAEDSAPNNSLYNYFAKMELDPVTTQRTLETPHTHLDSDVFLKAVDKALKVYHKKEDTDDRDSLAYQSVHDFADMISEKIGKDQNRVLRNQLWKLTRTGSLKSMPSGVLNKHLDHLFNVSGLAQALEEVSPLDAVAQNERVVKLGEGGIPTVQQAPMNARAVQPSYLGYIDAVAGPESLRVGLDMFMAHNVRRGKNDNLLYTRFINPKSGKREWVSTKQAVDSTIAFPEYLKTNEDYVPAVIKGDKMGYAHRKDVDYIVPSGDELYSSMVNFIPLKSGIKGMRTLMGAKYPKQAMPLVENEVPLVDTKVSQPDGSEISMSRLLGKYNGAKFAPTSGTVKAVYKDHIVFQGDDGKKHRIDLYNNLPLARKTVLDNTASVKAGDKVNKGDLLAISNFTDKEGRAAPGKNLDVAYMNYKGSTFEDAVVISEKAADKLKHIALYPVDMDKEPELIYDKHRYRTLFPSKFNSKQMAKLDDRGIIKPGSIVEYGDPLITGVRKKVPELSSLGRRIQLDETETWDHHTRGVVTDVAETDKGYKVFIRAEEPMKEADKLALRVGGKGVVARIIKNADMPKNENGDPIDVVISRLTIPSRTNSAQMIEATLGKVAAKTGKRYELPGFLDQPLHKFAEEEAKKHNVKINEDLYDPETGKKIPGVFVGKLYAMKTQQTSESKGKARSIDFYGLEGEPGRGGKHGSKHMGCFVPHQKIDTLHGPQRISNLVEKKHSEYVWTYDKDKNEWGYKPITNWFKYRASVDDIISIDVSGALCQQGTKKIKRLSTLSCTKNHKIYLYDGTVKLAGELKEGDELITSGPVPTDDQYAAALGTMLKEVRNIQTNESIKKHKTISKLAKVPARIKKIRPYKHPKKGVKEINVYDFTVADTHCYSTGSILVSNSMELEALIGHQASKVLKDTKLIRGQKNDEFWRDVKEGRTPTIPDTPLAYEKFKNLVRAAGVNYDEGTVSDSIFAMTNQQAKNLTGNRKLQNARTFAKDTLKPLPKGLFDPDKTGSTSKGDKWAFYETPEPMLNPIMETSVKRLLGLTSKEFDRIVSGEKEYKGDRGGYALRKMLQDADLDIEERKAKEIISNGPKSKLDKAVKKYRVIKSLKNKGVRPEDFMMTRIPVLPPKHRPIKKMQDITLVADLNHLYKELYNAMEDYKDVKEADVPEDVKQNARHTMYKAYKDLTGITKPVKAKLQERNVGGIISQLFGKDNAKSSLVKRKVLETNVDVAGMGVVAPNPALKLNQVGLPVNQAWDLYEPFIIQYMIRNNVPATTAAREVEIRSKRAFNALQKVAGKRPVIINRAPSLHKYSMMALWPRLVRGDVVQVPPQIVEPMGMDFDGDEQINTVLIALPKENKGCLSKNLFGNSEDWNYIKAWKNQKENSMAYVNFGVAGEKSYDFYVIDLEEFPHMEKVSSKEHRTFYRVPEGVKVIAFDEAVNKPVLTDAALWSEHKDREVWLVNLSNKKQIITDDDERAVYGILKGTYDFVRRRPVEAMDVLVPQMRNTDSIYNETFLTLPTKKYYTETNAITNHIHSGITLDSNFGYLLGAVAGDGWVTYDKDKVAGQVNIAGIEKAVIDKVKKVVSKLFPKYTPKWHSRQSTDSMGRGTTHVFTSIEVAKMLTDLIGRGAHNKHLPPFWHRTKREFRIGLLSGLLDTDGSICVTHGKKKPQLACNVGSTSLRLLREAQQLLFSLGIYSKILFSTKTKSNNDFWMLSISAVDIYKVKNELVCEKQRIHRSLEECKPEGTSKQAVKNDMIPIDKETANALYKRLRVLNKEGKVKSGLYSALNRSKKTGRVPRTTFNKAVDFCPDIEIPVQLKKIAENTEITWAYVKDIENTGKKETGYDLTVPGYETFMSMDGVILSNTASYTVPVSDQAVQEAVNKMMPGKHLISGRRNEPNFIPSQEYAEGLYYASKEPRRQQPVRFASEQAMKEAYKRGEIQVDTPVVIG